MYLVFRCPRCGHFLYSPFGQKTRHCPYCTKIVKINPAAAHLAKDDETARSLVKQYNAGKNLKNFLKLRRRDGNQIIPHFLEVRELENREEKNKKRTRLKQIRDKQLLLRILVKFASEPRSLNDLEPIFLDNFLDVEWAHAELEKLIQKQKVSMPRPWEIQYLPQSSKISKQKDPVKRPQNIPKAEIRRMLINFIRKSEEPISFADIKTNFSFYKDTSTLEALIMNLLQQGLIFEPKSQTYLWTGER